MNTAQKKSDPGCGGKPQEAKVLVLLLIPKLTLTLHRNAIDKRLTIIDRFKQQKNTALSTNFIPLKRSDLVAQLVEQLTLNQLSKCSQSFNRRYYFTNTILRHKVRQNVHRTNNYCNR